MANEIKERISVEVQGVEKLDALTKREQALAQEIERGATVADRAANRQKLRDTQMSRFKKQLDKLSLEELRHTQAVARGATQDDEATRRTDRRRKRIERLSRAIAQKQRADEMATAAVKKHKQATDHATHSTDGMAKSMHGASGGIVAMTKSMAMGMAVSGSMMAVVAGLTKAAMAYTAELNKQVELSDKIKQAQLDLQFLSQGYRPDEIAMVRKASEIIGGENAQATASQAFAELKSQTASMGELDRIKLFEQMVETSLTTSAPITDLTRLFVEVNKRTGDPERTQALIRKGQELSPAASPTVLGQALPQVLEAGGQVGLVPEQILGLLVTALNTDRERGTTSLRNIMTILNAPEAKPQQDVIVKYGADPKLGMLAQLDKLAEGGIPVGDMVNLVGRENITTFSGLINRRSQTQNFIGQLFKATTGKRDLTKEAIKNIFKGDRAQALRQMKAQYQAEIDNELAKQAEAENEWETAKVFVEDFSLQNGVGFMKRGLNSTKMTMHWLMPGNTVENAISDVFSDTPSFGLDTIFPGMYLGANQLSKKALTKWRKGPNFDVSQIGQAFNDAQAQASGGGGMTVNVANQNIYGTDPQTDFRKPFNQEDR